MAQTKRKKILQVSAAGKAVWPWVNRPDTKYDPDGVYRIKIAVDPSDEKQWAKAQKMVEQIDAALAGIVAKTREETGKKKIPVFDMPYQMEKEKDENGEATDTETGRLLFSFKLKAKGKTQEGVIYDKTVKLFRADGVPLAKEKIVGGGSVVQASYEMGAFYSSKAGVSLRLEAIRVLELIEYTGRDAKGYGFDTDDEYGNGAEDEDGDDSALPVSRMDNADDDEDDDDEDSAF